MPDIEKIINYIQVVLKLIFGDHVPPWVFPIIGYICLAAFILWVFRELLVFLATVKKLWVEELVPTLYNAEEKRRAQQRQRFADHVESERRYWAFIHANYLALFPKLIDRSQFNRRARSLRYLLNELCQDWAAELGVQFERHFLLDTTPVIAVGYRRDKSRSDFLGSAEYGYCSARRLKYFGYKLVMLTTLNGTPTSFELVPANTDERDAADEILDTLPPGSQVWSDKGFLGEDWQAGWDQLAVRVWTAKRENQHDQNPAEFDRLLNRVRERVEGAFDLLKEGGRSIEHTLAHTVAGLCSRIIAKIAGGTLRLLLHRFFGIDVLTYMVSA